LAYTQPALPSAVSLAQAARCGIPSGAVVGVPGQAGGWCTRAGEREEGPPRPYTIYHRAPTGQPSTFLPGPALPCSGYTSTLTMLRVLAATGTPRSQRLRTEPWALGPKSSWARVLIQQIVDETSTARPSAKIMGR